MVIKRHLLFSAVLSLAVACTTGENTAVTSTVPIPPSTEVAAETTTTRGPTTSTVIDRLAAWEEDIDTLRDRLDLLHPNPFWRADQAEFESDLALLKQSVAELSDEEIVLELTKLVARIDGHTSLSLSQDVVAFGRYQIRFYEFDDGVFVVESPDDGLVGARLVSVSGVDVEEVLERVSSYAQWDNSQTVRNLRTLFLVNPLVLEHEGVIDDQKQPRFELQVEDGSTVVVNPSVLDPGQWREWVEHPVLPPARASLEHETMTDEPIWWAVLDAGNVVYVQYNFVTALGGVVAELEAHVSENEVARIVVDMRRNPGGDNTTIGPLRTFLREVSEAGVDLVLITSRQTFSAAANFSTYMDVEADARFVGEEMGGSPNLYGDARTATLPNSRVEVRISSRYWEIGGPDDTRETIEPDIPVAVTSADHFGGLDPVLEAALAD